MENYRLLEKHRKKLSLYFALFILLSLWIIEWTFLASTFWWNNVKLEKKIEMKYVGVINIINNLPTYSLKEDDSTLQKILEKSLEWITIFKNNIKIYWNIKSYNLWEKKAFFNNQNYKYYQNTYSLNDSIYKIIIKTENRYSYNTFIHEFLLFLFFSLPFFIIFYLIGYIFVWKNLQPIKETIDSLETFSWNINHEMKTPLTEIISTLSLTKETKNNYEKAIEESLYSAKKLNKILDSMLWIINLVDSSYKKQKINIVNEIKEIIKENEVKIKEKNIIIKHNLKNRQNILYTNQEHLNICISNIIKNALKYSFKDSIVKINFDKWRLEIIDYWEWIEKKNLDKIYKRYFRESYSKKWWYGLWLALVKKIIDINKWDIEVKSKKNKWTKVILIFNSEKKWKE